MKQNSDFMGKVLNDLGSAWSATLVVIEDKLGLYKAMSDSKPVTPAEVLVLVVQVLLSVILENG